MTIFLVLWLVCSSVLVLAAYYQFYIQFDAWSYSHWLSDKNMNDEEYDNLRRSIIVTMITPMSIVLLIVYTCRILIKKGSD